MGLLYFNIITIVLISSIDAVCNVAGSKGGIVYLTEWAHSFQNPVMIELDGQISDVQDCVWDITVSKGSFVRLTLDEDSLQEGHLADGAVVTTLPRICVRDASQFDDGTDMIGICAHSTSKTTWTSEGNTLRVIRHWNRAKGDTRFTASYTGVCGGLVSANSLLATPNFPNPPPEGVKCVWTLRPPSRNVITIVKIVGLDLLQENATFYSKLPPSCGHSPLEIEYNPDQYQDQSQDQYQDQSQDQYQDQSQDQYQDQDQHEEHELCLENSIQWYSFSSANLIFSPTIHGRGWEGQVYVAFQDQIQCDEICVHHTSCLASSVPYRTGRIFYECVCQEGYTGYNCEVKRGLLDPCVMSPSCVHGECVTTVSLGTYKSRCRCDKGFTGENCTVALPDSCTGVVCHNSGVCMAIDASDFVCVCPLNSGYTGKICNIPIGSGYCSLEQDAFPGSQLLWSDTPVNGTDVQPCPGQAIGNASRYCISDQFSPSGGMWTRPDLSMCVSPHVLQLSVDAMQLLEPTAAMTTPSIANITSRLLNITKPMVVLAKEMPYLYPGDLLLAADVMKVVSKAAEKVNILGTKEARGITQEYTSAVDNLVDPMTEPTWRNARAHLVENRVTSVIEATQNLISILLRRIPTLRLEAGNVRSARTGGGGVGNGGSGGSGHGGGNRHDVVLSLKARNIDISVTQLRHDNVTSYFHYDGPTSSVQFSTSILSGHNSMNGPGHQASVYVARFQSLSALLSMRECRLDRSNTTAVINSDVMSTAVLYASEEQFSSLRSPIVLTFSLKDTRLKDTKMEKCVFMNMNAMYSTDRWSSRGCQVASSNDSHVVCHCYHLTNFAVLMDVYQTQDALPAEHDDILTYISYIGSVMSIIACFITIGTFQYLGLTSDRVRIHQQLGLSIIMVQVLFICVGVTGDDHGTPLWGCQLLSILLHYSLTAMFCWMLVEGIHIYVVLVRVFKLGSHLKKYTAMGWGIPLVVVAISVAIFLDHYGSGKICWIDHELLLVCFVPTVGLVVMINTLILGIVIRTMMNSNNVAHKISRVDHNNFRVSVKATAVLLPLLGLTWVLGFLAVETGGTHAMTYIFTYLFTLTNSFQGVLFFVFHCLLNVDVHQAYERRYMRRKRLSLAETLSTRTRKSSVPDFFSPDRLLTLNKNTNTTRSTLTNLSVGGDQRSSIKTTDRDPFFIDVFPRFGRFPNRWQGFSAKLIPEPDYPNSFRWDQTNNDSFQAPHEPIDDALSLGQGHNAESDVTSFPRNSLGQDHPIDHNTESDFASLPRNSRTSVRFT